MSTKRRSGLGLELIELAHALESVRLVTDVERARAFPAEADALAAPRAVSATVGLVAHRLRELGTELSREPRGGGTANAPAPRTNRGRTRPSGGGTDGATPPGQPRRPGDRRKRRRPAEPGAPRTQRHPRG